MPHNPPPQLHYTAYLRHTTPWDSGQEPLDLWFRIYNDYTPSSPSGQMLRRVQVERPAPKPAVMLQRQSQLTPESTAPVEQRPKRLLDQGRDAIRLRHYSMRNEEVYVTWRSAARRIGLAAPNKQSDGPHPGRICPGRPSLATITLGFRWRRCGDASRWLTLPPIRLGTRNQKPGT